MVKRFCDTGQTLVTKVDAGCIKFSKMMAVKNAEAQRSEMKATYDTESPYDKLGATCDVERHLQHACGVVTNNGVKNSKS